MSHFVNDRDFDFVFDLFFGRALALYGLLKDPNAIRMERRFEAAVRKRSSLV